MPMIDQTETLPRKRPANEPAIAVDKKNPRKNTFILDDCRASGEIILIHFVIAVREVKRRSDRRATMLQRTARGNL